ncbi:unnamed protein product, partial [Gongylonema pulchrum]|uniref:YebC/PmpR family DNA-binding transcriptional regulator n=1 Tax=Gongylonema pulchrum TaxID=637853 RepID=A0A183EUG4_9BILA
MVSKTKAAEQLMHKMKRAVRAGGPDPKFNKDLVQLQLEYRAANFSDEAFQRDLKHLQQQPAKIAQVTLRGPSASIIVVETEGISKKKLQELILTHLEKSGGGFRLTQNDYSRAFEEKGVVVMASTKADRTAVTLET